MTPRPDPANPFSPPSAQLIVGGIFHDHAAWEEAEEALVGDFGPFTAECLSVPFDHSDYYQREMGTDLVRVFRVFRDVVLQEDLARIKRRTVLLEGRFARHVAGSARRRVNIDPGLLSLSTLVLASTKGFAHRVYLGEGIHAEVTLIYQGRGFQPVPWTYPDYRQPAALAFFAAVRDRWRSELRAHAVPAALSETKARRCS